MGKQTNVQKERLWATNSELSPGRWFGWRRHRAAVRAPFRPGNAGHGDRQDEQRVGRGAGTGRPGFANAQRYAAQGRPRPRVRTSRRTSPRRAGPAVRERRAIQGPGRTLRRGRFPRAGGCGEHRAGVFRKERRGLREKLEAARQRIASQVAKNAEAAHDGKVSERIPVAAEAAQGFADTAKDKADQAAEKIAPDDASASASSIDAPAPCDAPPGQPCHSEAK